MPPRWRKSWTELLRFQIDPRVRIVWEDCGAFPFTPIWPKDVAHAREAEDFTRKFSHLREHGATGVVTKGMICLDWTDFNTGRGLERIGECNAGEIARPPSRAGSCAYAELLMQKRAHLQAL